jgi:hypothetical protein
MSAPGLPPVKVKTPPAKKLGGNGHYSTGGASGQPSSEPPAGWPKKRNSIFPFLVDAGAVTAGFGFIIVRPLAGETIGYALVGLGLSVVAIGVIGWIYEAVRDYRQMSE